MDAPIISISAAWLLLKQTDYSTSCCFNISKSLLYYTVLIKTKRTRQTAQDLITAFKKNDLN